MTDSSGTAQRAAGRDGGNAFADAQRSSSAVPGIRWLQRNRILLGIDLVGWALIPLLALELRLDGGTTVDGYLLHLVAFAVTAGICKFAALWFSGLYRRYWRYASIDELYQITLAIVLAGVVAGAAYLAIVAPVIGPVGRLPRAIPILDPLLTMFWSGGFRFAVRLWFRLKQRRDRGVGETVLIVGAGHAGTMIVKELDANPQLGLDPVGFVDDDRLKHGQTVLGLPVFGDRERIPEVAKRFNLKQVIIAMPTAPGNLIRKIHEVCEQAGLKAKIIPGVSDIISGRVSVNHLRDVRIEDLLRREPVRINERRVTEILRGATVLTTGAGGSIGSEICRQVARHGPARLVLLGHGENSIFDIHNELTARFPQVETVPVIADVRDERRIKSVFDLHRPRLVFHAAAHKHVPLMEWNPVEAVTNNVLGTLNVAQAAERAGVERFVLISTDKAVNPANIMGATKLVAEMIVQDVAIRTGRPFVSVRFGNVLASRGSVVPLFQQQIAAGGPVTVTHPEIMRYFMTIPEAVQLVLQAAALGDGGETFVLDMGEPVRIADLARDLIHLSGLEIGRDIEIVFSGLRSGEKMYEELFGAAERRARTEHEKVFVVQNGKPDCGMTQASSISRLVRAAQAGNLVDVDAALRELLPNYAVRCEVEPAPRASSTVRAETTSLSQRSAGWA